MPERKRNTQRTSLIRISDVLKSGEKLSTEQEGVRRYLLPGLDVRISSLPAGRQGGDFYGMVYLQHGRTAVFLGDISGHDFSSSIVATQVIEYIDQHQDALLHPHLFLRRMAITLFKKLTAVGRFFTAAICVVDMENNLVTYASAGHPPSLHFHDAGGHISELGAKSLPVGFDEEITYQLLEATFLAGDVLLMHTDGLSTARSPEREEFGMERIQNIMSRWAHEPGVLVPRLLESACAFTGTKNHSDDLTAICLARTS